MKVTQIYNIINTITSEHLGETAVLAEDLSNIVDIGETYLNAVGVDNYVKALNDQIGKMIFVDRVYKGRLPSVYMDAWEYGSMVEKVAMDLPQADENETWELTDGAVYEPNQFYKPSIYVKLWNKRVTFEIPISIVEKQAKSSFASATQMNKFVSMIFNAVSNAITLKLDDLIMRTVNNAIAETVYADYGATDKTKKSGIKAVNLLYRYNSEVNKGEAITVQQALVDPEFIRFTSKVMGDYMDRMSTYSTLFNIEGKERFTPNDRLHIAMLSEFKNSAGAYLQSDTFHDSFVKLPNAETVPFWQGSGTDYAFASTSKIDVTTGSNHAVTVTGVLAIMWDRDALGVANLERYTTSNYNPKAEFFNYWHKNNCGLFNDPAENVVVFFIA